MRQLFQKSILMAGLCLSFGVAVAQTNLPQDYLSPAFHKGRREAARALMPDSSVLVVFAAPTRNFSNDVDYQYHQNPDLYYFTGYKEPHAVLLLFKEAQTSGDGKRYNELFFVQKRDARAEQWNGRRLGVEGVKKQLGIESAYNGDDFKDFPLDLSRLRVIFRLPEGTVDEPNSTGDLYDLVSSFRQKAAIPSDYDDALYNDLSLFTGRATIENIDRIIANFKSRAEVKESYRTNKYVQWILGIKDSAALETVRVEINNARLTAGLFHSITGALREIKTPEEMELIRKAVKFPVPGKRSNESCSARHVGIGNTGPARVRA
jgi:Xaa-Pro aminopeptidase